MRNRLPFIFIVAVGIAIPRVGHVTIVNREEKYFDGFRISSTEQIGCATTRDYPTEETSQRAQATQKKLIQETENEIVKSYKYYSTGDHPFKHLLKYLDRARRNGSGGPLTNRASHRGVDDELNLRESTPQLLVFKIPYEFILAQAFRAHGFAATTLKLDEQEFLTRLNAMHDPFGYLEPVIVFAVQHADKLREWEAHPEPMNPNSQESVNRNSGLIRARALARVLQRKPYGKAFIKEAKDGWEGNGNLQFMLLISSDVNREDVKDILQALGNKDLTDYYRPLTQ